MGVLFVFRIKLGFRGFGKVWGVRVGLGKMSFRVSIEVGDRGIDRFLSRVGGYFVEVLYGRVDYYRFGLYSVY